MASRISRKVCTLGRSGALGTGRWGSIQDHSASDKSVWYALLMLGTLPSHLLKAPFRTVSPGTWATIAPCVHCSEGYEDGATSHNSSSRHSGTSVKRSMPEDSPTPPAVPSTGPCRPLLHLVTMIPK